MRQIGDALREKIQVLGSLVKYFCSKYTILRVRNKAICPPVYKIVIFKKSNLYISKIFSLEGRLTRWTGKSEDNSWVLKFFRKIRTHLMKFMSITKQTKYVLISPP